MTFLLTCMNWYSIFSEQVWENEYERDMKEYREQMKVFYANPNFMKDFVKDSKPGQGL